MNTLNIILIIVSVIVGLILIGVSIAYGVTYTQLKKSCASDIQSWENEDGEKRIELVEKLKSDWKISELNKCPTDLTKCNTKLSAIEQDNLTCNTKLSATEQDNLTCNTKLSACNASLTTCNADKTTCKTALNASAKSISAPVTAPVTAPVPVAAPAQEPPKISVLTPAPLQPTVSSDPCGTDPNARNLSNECINKIWKDAGCSTTPSIHIKEGGTSLQWAKERTKQELVNDYKAWATLPNASHRTACYGTSSAITNGRYIKIVRPTVGCLNLAEIQVYSVIGGANIAKTAKITKSSSYGADLYPVSNFVDDNLNTFGHTSCNDIPWVLLDFGKDIPISKIVIQNRRTNKGRINGSVLTIANNTSTNVYTSKPIVGVSGSIVPVENEDGYLVYTIIPPNTTVVGSNV